MDRLNRMLQAAQGMGMGSAAPGGVSDQKPWLLAMCPPFEAAVFAGRAALYAIIEQCRF
jgi:hypothetical protein